MCKKLKIKPILLNGNVRVKRYLCWNCIFLRICKFNEPTLVKCKYLEFYEKYFNEFIQSLSNKGK